MKNAKVLIVFLFITLGAVAAQAQAADANAVGTNEAASVKAAVIECHGLIDDGLYKSIKRRSEAAIEDGCRYLIYQMQTYGGLVKSADDISKYLIHEIPEKARTVAYINTEAVSAGAIISVSCQDIIMRENTTIGDAAPIVMGGKLEGVEREKAESFVRSMFARAAKANGYPQPLLEAMVTMRMSVYRVRNTETDGYEYFSGDDLPDDANEWSLSEKERIVGDEEILMLLASEAKNYDLAAAVVGDMQGALAFLQGRDGVRIERPVMVLEPNWSEQMVRWLNSPAVMGVLVMLSLLGAYIELSSPGVGLPGLAALICVVIIIGSKHLTGLANWLDIALFTAGILLLLVEFFIIPGFGIAGVLGVVCTVIGLLGMLVRNAPDEFPWPSSELDWQTFGNGVLGLSFGIVGFGVLAWILTRYLPKIQLFSGLMLSPNPAVTDSASETEITAEQQFVQIALKVGDTGRVTSKLRPAGTARFGEQLADVVAEGEFLDRGDKVEITQIHGNRIVVRKIEEEQ